uniref:hypothetical protein n=1 Tax=Qipengyuania sp. TaxID=2004515 RepID=UPI0035C851FC
MRSLFVAPVLLVSIGTIAGCAPGDPRAAPSDSAADPATEAGAEAMAEAPADKPSRIPDDLTGTAWRASGADGGSYTTFLDADGRYRDVKNGEPFHDGAWDRRADGSICFLPDGTEAQRRCWTPDGMTDEGNMVVVGGED